MVLASLSGTGLAIVLGVYVLVVLLAFAISPRDVTGRKRATGCIIGLVIFGGAFVAAFAAWAADHVF